MVPANMKIRLIRDRDIHWYMVGGHINNYKLVFVRSLVHLTTLKPMKFFPVLDVVVVHGGGSGFVVVLKLKPSLNPSRNLER